MSWWRKLFHIEPESDAPGSHDLHFAGPEEALRYACDYLKCEMSEGVTLPCIVDDVDGQIAAVRVANGNGPVAAMAMFSKAAELPPLYIGSLCAVLVGPELNGVPRPLLVVAALRPVLARQGWAIERPLT